MKKNKLIKVSLLALALAAVLGYGIYAMTYTPPRTYMTASAQVRDLKQQVYATGTLSGKVAVDVGAQVSGQITKLYVQKGDVVKMGDLLCEIDPDIQENNLKRAEAQEKLIAAQIRSKQAQIEMLKSEHLRQEKLLKSNATSVQSAQQAKAQYLMGQADLDALKAQYEQAQIAVADARKNLSYTKITAPMDGTVYAIPVEEGQTVNANQTTPTILKLAKLAVMTVEAEISEADVVRVAPGQECQFTIMGLPNQFFDARLRSIDPAPASADKDNNSNTTEQAIYYNALLDVDNPQGLLRIDMTAEVVITIAQAQGVNAIPISALRNEKNNGTAEVLQLKQDGTIISSKVKLGIRDEQYVQILNKNFDMDTPLIIGDDVATAASSVSKPRQRKNKPF